MRIPWITTPPVTSPGKFTIITRTGTAVTPGFPGFLFQGSQRGSGDSGAVDITGRRAFGTLDGHCHLKRQELQPADGANPHQSVHVNILPPIRRRSPYHVGLIDDTATNYQLNGGAPAVADFISARIFPCPTQPLGTSPGRSRLGRHPSPPAQTPGTFNNTQSANFNLILGDW